MERTAFFSDRDKRELALFNIERIGESANRVPQEIRDANPQIPWGDIIGARNRIIHDYDRIKEDVVWEIVQTGVPDLLPKLRRMVEEG